MPRPYRANVRGFTTIYTLVILVALVAVCSLGADYGRVQLAKLELRRAVDAAARSAALSLRQERTPAQARADAVATATDNRVDGRVLSLATNEVEIGNWAEGVFTPNRSPVNAVRISVKLSEASGSAVPLTFA